MTVYLNLWLNSTLFGYNSLLLRLLSEKYCRVDLAFRSLIVTLLSRGTIFVMLYKVVLAFNLKIKLRQVCDYSNESY